MKTVRITVIGAPERQLCFACGNITVKSDVFAMLEGDAMCDDCLEAGPEQIVVKMTEYAEELSGKAIAFLKTAERLRRLAEDSYVIATLAELMQTRREQEAR
jgi:hypothetical protein